MSGRWASLGALGMGLVLFVALNIVCGALLRGARVDLTEGKLYTLSGGSRAIARKLDEPITLTFYYSERVANDLPAYKTHAARVREVLEEYAAASEGKIRVRVVKPEPFSDEEDAAVNAGLIGLPASPAGDRLYLGLVGVNSTDAQEVIRFFDPERGTFLEYDLTRLIYALSNPAKAVVGLISGLPISGGAGNPFQPQRAPAWQVYAQMRDFFDLREVAAGAGSIPDDVRVLVVIHPKGLPDETLYAIDQFVLRGGRLVAFVDPHCEADIPPDAMGNPMAAMTSPKDSNLDRLFAAWGIEMAPDRLSADRERAIRVTVGGAARSEQVDYVLWLALGEDALNRDDPVTGSLRRLNVATAGSLVKKPDATIAFTPLVTTGPAPMRVDKAEVQFMPDPAKLLAGYVPLSEPLVLAARLSGSVKSAFPEGDPSAATPAEGEAAEEAPAAKRAHLGESVEPINVIVFADCDVLDDRFWAQEERLFQQVLGYRKIADNGDFLIGAVDNLSGSSDLIAVRARAGFARPFEKVQRIARAAEDRYRAEEQALQQKIEATQERINEIQRQRPDGGDAGMILTPEQQAELAKLQQEMIETRKKLRGVQHELTKDIERLENRVKAVNIGLVPGVVALTAVGLGAYRVRRRRGDPRLPGAQG